MTALYAKDFVATGTTIQAHGHLWTAQSQARSQISGAMQQKWIAETCSHYGVRVAVNHGRDMHNRASCSEMRFSTLDSALRECSKRHAVDMDRAKNLLERYGKTTLQKTA